MDLVKKIQDDLRQKIVTALEKAKTGGKFNYQEIPAFVIEVPREKQHGDYACNVAMLLARQARMSPVAIGQAIIDLLPQNDPLISRVEVKGAGFINFFLKEDWLFDVPRVVWQSGESYGQHKPVGKKVQVEFVSANPTGDLHMGNARGGLSGIAWLIFCPWRDTK